jgi:hypothetical protein
MGQSGKSVTLPRAAVLGALALAACSGATAASGDGGAGGATSAQSTAMCSTTAAWFTACNLFPPACASAIVDGCASFTHALSPAYVAAVAACPSSEPCVAATDCIEGATSSLTPSSAQDSVAQEYCAACGDASQSAAQCAQTFFFTAPPGSSAPGVGVLEVGDSVASAVHSACAGSSSCATFTSCLQNQLSLASPLPAAVCVPTVSATMGDGGGGS